MGYLESFGELAISYILDTASLLHFSIGLGMVYPLNILFIASRYPMPLIISGSR